MVKPPFMEIACPVCSKPVRTLERYPRSLCPECSARVTDRSGRPVVFYDIQALPTPNSSGVRCLTDFTDITPIPGCKKPTPVQPATLME